MDMAKEEFVLFVYDSTSTLEFSNTPKSIRKMLKDVSKMLKVNLVDCLCCFEHTGLYSLNMMLELDQQNLNYAVVPGLAIKKSMGITRGKSDHIDARKIAEYAYMRQEKLPLFQIPSKGLQHLKALVSLRSMHVKSRASYLARKNEQFKVMKKTHYPLLFSSQERTINHYNKEIKKVEAQIAQVIEENEPIKKCYDLLISITGIGPVVATQTIVKTQCFTVYQEWRKFACYCGTAPFPNESGNLKNAWRISKIGDRDMKKLLTLAARSAVQYDVELKMFYQRKLKEGKTKKNVTNAVRNKLLARMFSVVKRGSPYVNMYKFAS